MNGDAEHFGDPHRGHMPEAARLLIVRLYQDVRDGVHETFEEAARALCEKAGIDICFDPKPASSSVKNLALRWLAEHNTCPGEIDCVELAGEVVAEHGGRIAWLEPSGDMPGMMPDWAGPHMLWRHHAVAVIDGIVHDGWGPGPRPLDQWIAAAFPGQSIRVEYPAEE